MSVDTLINAIVSLATTVLGAVLIIIGWKVAYRQEMKRDITAKRRELRVQYLIDAYRRLEYVSHRPLTQDVVPDLENAIADIQLFGSNEQVILAQQFTRDFVQNRSASLDQLLSDLRQSLRQEIDLVTVTQKLTHLRITFDEAE